MKNPHNPTKTTRTAASILAALFLAVACLSGCATVNGGGNAALLADLRDVATVGAALDLRSNPGHRAAYEQAIAALDAVAKLDGATAGGLHAALAQLPIRELKGEKAILYVTAAQILMRRVLDGREPVAVPGAVRDVAGALRDGLKGALKP